VPGITSAPRGKGRHGTDLVSCDHDVESDGDVRGTLTNTWRKDGQDGAPARVRKGTASM
jgi:hypothetical protein